MGEIEAESPPLFRFEEMEDRHLQDVTDICNHYVLNSTSTFIVNPLSAAGMKETLTFDSPRHRSYVVMHGEEVCGYCFISPFKNRDAYADTAEVTVYLRPGFTGKGAGGLAVDFMEGEARQRGFHCLIAVICAENGPSIRLFEKKGFQRCAHYREVGRKFGRLLDVVVYQKIIS